MPTGLDNLKHIVVLMMCNRSFDHMLGFAATPSWQIDGLTGQEKNRDSTGEFAQVSNDARYSGDFTPDPGHALFDTFVQIYGDPKTSVAETPLMNGFVLSYEGKTHNPTNAHRIMKCFSPDKIPVLTTLAREFAICDRWFASVPGPTFPNRAFVHGATSSGRVDMGVDWFGTSRTIYQLLAAEGLDSRIYYHDSTMAMTFGGLMNQGRYFALYDDFLSDCKHNRLPAYSFIEPRYANGEDLVKKAFYSASDQHPDHNVQQGEILIRDTFNAIWENQTVRESTLLVVTYDCHGGLYDHVPPPATVNPDGMEWHGSPNSLDPPFDFTRLGGRVPAVLISPYIPAGTIDHTEYDHTSIIATVSNLLMLQPLTRRDKNANTFEKNLNLTAARTDNVNFALTATANQSLTALGQTHLDASHIYADIGQHLEAHVAAASLLENRILPPSLQSGVNPDDIRSEKQASDFLSNVNARLLEQAKAQSMVFVEGASAKAPSTRGRSEPPTDEKPIATSAYPTPKIVSDRWASNDALGYEAYARTLAGLIAHPDTVPPLTIGIKAAWGVGKTSLMKRVQHLLDGDADLTEQNRASAVNQSQVAARITLAEILKRLKKLPAVVKKPAKSSPDGLEYGISPRNTVWFNAWKYQTSEQIWAGLAHCIITQVTARMEPEERELFWLKLHSRRVSKEAIRRKIYELVFTSTLPTILLLIFGCALIIGAFSILPYFGLYSPWFLAGKLAAPISAFFIWWRKRTEKLGETAATTLKEIVQEPDYAGKSGFLHLVESDIRDVLELVADKDSPLVIFVDDLDRCIPRKIAEVVEAINLSLSGDYPNCVFVLGMEPTMVAAALEVANKDVIEKLTQFSLETSPAPLGWRFLEKIIQLPVTIPPPTDSGMAFYLKSLTAGGEGELEIGHAKQEKVRSFQKIFQETQTLAEVDQLTEKLSSEASREDRIAIAEASNQRYIEKSTNRDPAVRQLLELATAPIGRNPRQIKRYINVFRFYAALRRVLKNQARAAGVEATFPSDEQLAKFITLTIQWPHAFDYLRISNPAKDGKTHNKASKKNPQTLLAALENASRSLDTNRKGTPTNWPEALKGLGLPADGWLARDEFREFLSSDPSLAGLEGSGLW